MASREFSLTETFEPLIDFSKKKVLDFNIEIQNISTTGTRDYYASISYEEAS